MKRIFVMVVSVLIFAGNVFASCQDSEMNFGRAVTVKKTGSSEYRVFYRSCVNGSYIEDLQGIFDMSQFPPLTSVEMTIEGTVDKKLHPDPIVADSNHITYIFRQDWILQTQPQNCPGKEWQLGRAIETGYRGVDKSGNLIWKAKVGVCNGDKVEFVRELHWQRDKFDTKDWSDYDILNFMFGSSNSNNHYPEAVSKKLWHEDVPKQRKYYVFEADLEANQNISAIISVINVLLL